MSVNTCTATCSAGAFVRRYLRVQLDLIGVDWTEHKGLLDSTFVVRGTARQFGQLADWFRQVEEVA